MGSNQRVDFLPTPHETMAALQALFEWADRVWIAYAWAAADSADSGHWRCLDLAKVERALIGIGFNGTDPDALAKLNEVPGRLKVYEPGEGRTFHPKVAVGFKGPVSRAIVGSSNLTAGGFGRNIEANVLIEGPEDQPPLAKIAKFVDDLWCSPVASPVDTTWVADYRSRYQPERVAGRTDSKSPAVDGGTTPEVFRRDWPTVELIYVEAEEADAAAELTAALADLRSGRLVRDRIARAEAVFYFAADGYVRAVRGLLEHAKSDRDTLRESCFSCLLGAETAVREIARSHFDEVGSTIAHGLEGEKLIVSRTNVIKLAGRLDTPDAVPLIHKALEVGPGPCALDAAGDLGFVDSRILATLELNATSSDLALSSSAAESLAKLGIWSKQVEEHLQSKFRQARNAESKLIWSSILSLYPDHDSVYSEEVRRLLFDGPRDERSELRDRLLVIGVGSPSTARGLGLTDLNMIGPNAVDLSDLEGFDESHWTELGFDPVRHPTSTPW